VCEINKDFKELKKFVKKTLGGIERICDPDTKQDCLPEEVEVLEKWGKSTPEEVAEESKRLKNKLLETLKSEQRKAVEFELKMLKLLQKGKMTKNEL